MRNLLPVVVAVGAVVLGVAGVVEGDAVLAALLGLAVPVKYGAGE